MNSFRFTLFSLGCAFGFVMPSGELRLSALRALKIAQRRLRPEVKSKLLSISSARTDASLIPDAWRFLFLDPTTNGKCRIVTVAAKTSSEHPDTVESFNTTKDNPSETDEIIAQNKLLIDSELVLEQACKNLNCETVSQVEYRLLQEQGEENPRWVLRFYGQKNETLAELSVNAANGDVTNVLASEAV